jgi:hypothetical protein
MLRLCIKVQLFGACFVQQNQFKLVCDSCGSLTIVLPSEAELAPFIVLKCGRCGSARGTLQALREMSSLGGRYLEAQMPDMKGDH